MAVTYDQFAAALVHAIEAYALIGFVFALTFVTAGISRMDAVARGAPWTFRAIVIPGVVALWPLLMLRWLRGVHEPPMQKDPHR
jgi:hypothetical protein